MIKIARISLKNYRQYKNVDLSFPDDKGVYIFTGDDQGVGKSNFMNAINWCLYEVEPFKTQNTNKGIVNELVKDNLGAAAEVTIEIHSDDRKLLITRKQIGNRDPELTLLMKMKDNNWKAVRVTDNPASIINGFLPRSVSNFFIFDGEVVENIFNSDYSENLKKGILKVSHVQVLDNAIDHLDDITRQLRRSTAKDIPDLQLLSDEQEQRAKDIKKNKEDLSSLRIECDAAKAQQKILAAKQSDINKYEEQIKTRDLLIETIDNNNKKLSETIEEKNNLVVKYTHYLISKKLISSFIDKTKLLNTENKIPAKVASGFVEELIESGTCICEEHLDEKKKNILRVLLGDSKSADRKEFLLEESHSLKQIFRSELPSAGTRLEQLMRQEMEINTQLKKYSAQLEEAKHELVNANDSDIASLQLQLQKYDDVIDETKNKILSLEYSIEKDESELKKKDDEYQELLSKKDIFKKKAAQIELSMGLKVKLSEIRIGIIEKVRNDLNNYTFAFFKQLMWNKDKYKLIEFDENYHVRAFKPNIEHNTYSAFSTGEMKVLGFAALKALGELSGFKEVPVFVDGPLEKLANKVQRNFLDSLSNFMPNKQVFIFTHEKDIITDFAEKSVPKNHRFQILQKKVDEVDVSEIVVVGGAQ